MAYHLNDILVKRGNSIQLIKVKAKSFDPTDENLLVGKIRRSGERLEVLIVGCGFSAVCNAEMSS